MGVIRSWSSPNARVCLFYAERGYEMIRETCPSTQIWLLLSGEWSERGDGIRHRVKPFETHRYAPKQPCRRIFETEAKAVSLELFQVDGSPVLSANELRATWQLTQLALQNRLSAATLEYAVNCFQTKQSRYAEPDWLRKAHLLVHANFRLPLTLESVAQSVAISPNHLSTEFRKTYGLSLTKMIRKLRLEDALRRMADESEPWLECGFYDASHFWHACQTDLGLTPKAIRALTP